VNDNAMHYLSRIMISEVRSTIAYILIAFIEMPFEHINLI